MLKYTSIENYLEGIVFAVKLLKMGKLKSWCWLVYYPVHNSLPLCFHFFNESEVNAANV